MQLQAHILQIEWPFRALWLAAVISGGKLAGVAIAGMVHVWRRVVEAKWHLVGPTSVRQLAHNVFSVRCARDFVVGIVRIKHATTVMVFCSEDHVTLSAFARLIVPRLR